MEISRIKISITVDVYLIKTSKRASTDKQISKGKVSHEERSDLLSLLT